MVDKVDKIWFNGDLIPWDQAKVHVLTHTLHYGYGCFEGIRCYKQKDGSSAIFRLDEHVRRLFDSAKILTLPMPFTEEQIAQGCRDTVRANKLDECYLRPLCFIGEGAMGLGAMKNPTQVVIIAWKWGAYLGEEGLKKGIRAKISSFFRPSVNALMSKGKVIGHYVNNILAKREALTLGFDEAILLDPQGYVCEASGENVFVVRGGRVATAPLGASILGGITRESLLSLLAQMSIPVVERVISRDELYTADEVFMCGTAAEVTPVREIDGRTIGAGSRGPITQRVQDRFFQVVRGTEAPKGWLTPI